MVRLVARKNYVADTTTKPSGTGPSAAPPPAGRRTSPAARAVVVVGVAASLVLATSQPAAAADLTAPTEPGVVTVSGVTATGAAMKALRS
jgi:hypothetical protein